LKLKLHKQQKIHGLTEAQKAAKNIDSFRQLGTLVMTSSFPKLFLLQKTHSQQADRVYSVLLGYFTNTISGKTVSICI
jgi:hypothetical protein